ncbi:hypothetical protein CONCODRAFT_7985 [Conidiobolus coronatus NRRL 28638]|uniref:AMP-dependent synthetase/ligase domain-containing protein n=1 Tax=Conidiobolus coronatus (strain ATCC 28846 / CBS 209.66 / NRRL 28638) TaxID=796925 RepID=A0A137P3H3_CONC2|nr:hypothetical protein CONCODRAFT_7985 [Conidiobolus coronatus NRRL 28638]|eukprot:KXN69572.1 hypothetical protein CONCODRAFT_7985 [Conidiobolus coronatus NRRL 28638]
MDLEIQGSDLTYLLFTLGTTGKPKGVMVSHSNLVSAVSGFSHVLPVHPKTQFITVGGESLSQQFLDIWAPEGKLYNCYGHTEATIGCSVSPKVV